VSANPSWKHQGRCELGQGQLDTRIIAVEGEDELAVLGSNINLMANQLQTQLRFRSPAERGHSYLQTLSSAFVPILTWKISSKRQSKKFRKSTQNKSVVIYRFDPTGMVLSLQESVITHGWTQALGEKINDPCFREGYAEMYKMVVGDR